MKHAVTILRGQSFGVACSSVTVIVGVMLQKVAENHQATHARQLVKAVVMVLPWRFAAHKTADLAHRARLLPVLGQIEPSLP